MGVTIVGFDVLEYFNVTEIEFILPVIFGLCAGILAYLWIKITSRDLPPGPRGLPFVGYKPFLGAELHKDVAELSKKYGKIFGLYMGPTYTVFVTDYSIMKETITQTAALDRVELFPFIPGGVGFGTMNGTGWQEQRRFCMQAMRDLGLGRGPWETLILEEVPDFADSLGKYKGKPINFMYLLISSVNNNILSLLIGRKMRKGIDDDKIKLMVDFTNTILLNSGVVDPTAPFQWLRTFLARFKVGDDSEMQSLIKKFTEFIRNEMKLHETSPELKNSEDFIKKYQEQIRKAISTGGGQSFFSENNLRGNMISLFLGASDTISTSLSWLFTLMAAHPNVQDKLHAELDNNIGKDVKIYYDDRKKLPYTMSVIMETLRHGTIVPMAGGRQLSEDITVRGYRIPKGTNIVTNIWSLHNDPDYWEQPEKFKPERFLSDDGKDVVKPKSFSPFTMGKRNCPGESVAYMEIFLYFSNVMQKYKVKVPEGKQVKFDVDIGLVCTLKPQELCFVERKH